MVVYTKRKVIDLDLAKDNELDLGTLSDVVKVYTNCPDTYIEKDVTDGKITLTVDDMDFLNTGQVTYQDENGNVTTTNYIINNELNSCSDINAANISKLRAKIMGGNDNEDNTPEIMTESEYDALGTKENKLYYIVES